MGETACRPGRDWFYRIYARRAQDCEGSEPRRMLKAPDRN